MAFKANDGKCGDCPARLWRDGMYTSIGQYPFRAGARTAHEKALSVSQPMLLVGTENTFTFPKHFLLIHDGEFDLAGKQFDYRIHSVNPVAKISYKGARDFITILNAIFPEGDNTLTRKNSNFVLLQALLDKPRRLDTLLKPSKDPAEQDAYQKVQTLLMSPVLENVLNRPTNFSFKGTVLVRLNRSELGDFDAFALAQFLIQQYKGTIVIPDYGFYAAPHHTSLIRDGRLIAGVNHLDELPQMLRDLLLLGETRPGKCLYDDAETLAHKEGIPRGSIGFTDFVYRAMH